LDHSDFGHLILPFGVAQGGELVEPFRISSFVLRIWLRLRRAVFSARDSSFWGGIIEKTREFVKERFAVREKETRKELSVPMEMFYFTGL